MAPLAEPQEGARPRLTAEKLRELLDLGERFRRQYERDAARMYRLTPADLALPNR